MSSLSEKKGYGEKIKNIRTELNLTLEEFGKMLSPPAPKSLVWNWERERNLPNKERLEQIAILGNVSIDYLLTGNSIKKNGYGERIKAIQRDKIKTTQEAFGRLFNPQVPSEEVEAWENESLLPTAKQIEKLTKLGEIDYRELILEKKRKYDTPFNPYIYFESTEEILEKANLSREDQLKSEHFFAQLDSLRRTQADNPQNFNLLFDIIANLKLVKWKDVDLFNQKLTIGKTLAEDENRDIIIQEPKTKSSQRTISLDRKTVKILEQWRNDQREWYFKFGLNTSSEDQFIYTDKFNHLYKTQAPNAWLHNLIEKYD